jgi:hypothetical protein
LPLGLVLGLTPVSISAPKLAAGSAPALASTLVTARESRISSRFPKPAERIRRRRCSAALCEPRVGPALRAHALRLLEWIFARIPGVHAARQREVVNYRHGGGILRDVILLSVEFVCPILVPGIAPGWCVYRVIREIGNWHTACFCLHFEDGYVICYCRKRTASSYARARHSC